jgi:hypothetical protein
MQYNHDNRKRLTEADLITMCREARERAASYETNDLLWSLLVRIREDLGVTDPRGGILPFGGTREEMLWNNIFQHFNHQYDWPLSLNISGTISRELLKKTAA